jgi:hypothetical protein
VCHQDAIISLGEGGIETCKCPEGWAGDGLACTPLPCTLDNGGCAVDATCTNAETAICTCPDGKIHLDGGLCVLPGDNYCEAPLPLVTSATGTTDGFEPEFDLQEGHSCLAKSAGVESPDVVYTFTAPSTGSFTFTLEATYAAVLYLRSVCFEGCLGAAEKEEGSNVLSVTVSLEEGQNVFVIVDGNVNELAPNQGPYTLSVAAVPPT